MSQCHATLHGPWVPRACADPDRSTVRRPSRTHTVGDLRAKDVAAGLVHGLISCGEFVSNLDPAPGLPNSPVARTIRSASSEVPFVNTSDRPSNRSGSQLVNSWISPDAKRSEHPMSIWICCKRMISTMSWLSKRCTSYRLQPVWAERRHVYLEAYGAEAIEHQLVDLLQRLGKLIFGLAQDIRRI